MARSFVKEPTHLSHATRTRHLPDQQPVTNKRITMQHPCPASGEPGGVRVSLSLRVKACACVCVGLLVYLQMP